MHTCIVNNKKYIGITCQEPYYKRFNGNGSGYKTSARFWNAIQKYGWDKFEHTILAEGVEKIDPCAFDNETGFIPDYWRSRFTEIVIPNSVKEIGKRAFNKCDKLQKVTLSSNLKSIGDSAFRKTGISEVIIPNSVETIGSVAFFECKNLKKIQLSQNLTQLGRQAFCRCDIREIDIPSSLSQIPFEAFRDNQNTDKITLHNGLEYIGERAFSYCYGITLT